MTPRAAPIVKALLDPRSTITLSTSEWEYLVRQGRRANLLARLAHKLTQLGLMDAIPSAPRNHLCSALQVAQRQEVALRWEVTCISLSFSDLDVRPILLKGAAYAMAGVDAAHGRTFADVDILVHKRLLGCCESQLMLHGWQTTNHDAYDQRYYRRWMHEIPPLRHVRRGTTLDLHHSILPETARIKVNTCPLIDAAREIPGQRGWYVLQQTDMVIHSATHLFHEGDFDKGLRDLFDLDSLLTQFGETHDFWPQLVPRAVTLGLTRPLYYALRYTAAMLGTSIPSEVTEAAEVGKPAALVERLMDACYERVFNPVQKSTAVPGTGFAKVVLYLRSHWIKMPFHLLTYHLCHKLLLRSNSVEQSRAAG
jgi:hypothetical protein